MTQLSSPRESVACLADRHKTMRWKLSFQPKISLGSLCLFALNKSNYNNNQHPLMVWGATSWSNVLNMYPQMSSTTAVCFRTEWGEKMATTHLLCRTLQMHVKQPRPDSSLNVSAPSVAEMSSRMVSRCGHSTMRNALVMPRILQRSRVLVSAGNLLHLKPSPMKKERFSASFTSPPYSSYSDSWKGRATRRKSNPLSIGDHGIWSF